MMNKTIYFIVSGLLVVALIGVFMSVQPKPLPAFDPFPSYPLTDQTNHVYDFNNNKIKLIAFFYTRCPDICPITIQDLARLHKELDKKGLLEEDVDILTITLDPEHDTREVLQDYRNKFDIPEDKSWYFLRGSDEDISKLTDDLGYFREETGGYWSHSTTMYLVDYENRKRTFFLMSNPNEPMDIENIIRDIQLLKKEHQKVVNE